MPSQYFHNDTMTFVVTGQENNDAARLCHLIISSLSVSAPGVGCQQLSSIAGQQQSTCLLQGAGSEVVHCVVWQARHLIEPGRHMHVQLCSVSKKVVCLYLRNQHSLLRKLYFALRRRLPEWRLSDEWVMPPVRAVGQQLLQRL